MITKKKLSYEGPVCEVFELQSEAVMQAGSPKYYQGGGGTYSPNEINDNGDDY